MPGCVNDGHSISRGHPNVQVHRDVAGLTEWDVEEMPRLYCKTSAGSRSASFQRYPREKFEPVGVIIVEEKMEVAGVLHGSRLELGKQHVILPGNEDFCDSQRDQVRACCRSVLTMSQVLN